MAGILNDNIQVNAPKPLNSWSYNQNDGLSPYPSVADAIAGVPLAVRHLSLTVLVNDWGLKEYRWKDGTADVDLVEKTGWGWVAWAIEGTYSEIESFQNSSSLVPTGWYKITDYETIHRISGTPNIFNVDTSTQKTEFDFFENNSWSEWLIASVSWNQIIINEELDITQNIAISFLFEKNQSQDRWEIEFSGMPNVSNTLFFFVEENFNFFDYSGWPVSWVVWWWQTTVTFGWSVPTDVFDWWFDGTVLDQEADITITYQKSNRVIEPIFVQALSENTFSKIAYSAVDGDQLEYVFEKQAIDLLDQRFNDGFWDWSMNDNGGNDTFTWYNQGTYTFTLTSSWVIPDNTYIYDINIEVPNTGARFEIFSASIWEWFNISDIGGGQYELEITDSFGQNVLDDGINQSDFTISFSFSQPRYNKGIINRRKDFVKNIDAPRDWKNYIVFTRNSTDNISSNTWTNSKVDFNGTKFIARPSSGLANVLFSPSWSLITYRPTIDVETCSNLLIKSRLDNSYLFNVINCELDTITDSTFSWSAVNIRSIFSCPKINISNTFWGLWQISTSVFTTMNRMTFDWWESFILNIVSTGVISNVSIKNRFQGMDNFGTFRFCTIDTETGFYGLRLQTGANLRETTITTKEANNGNDINMDLSPGITIQRVSISASLMRNCQFQQNMNETFIESTVLQDEVYDTVIDKNTISITDSSPATVWLPSFNGSVEVDRSSAVTLEVRDWNVWPQLNIIDLSGNASTNNITVQPAATTWPWFDASPSKAITRNYGHMTIKRSSQATKDIYFLVDQST